MNLIEVKALLTFREHIEGVGFDDAAVQSWSTCLEGVGYLKALDAAVEHYRKSTKPLRPAHILERA